MNKTSRTNEPLKAGSGFNQSPTPFSNDLTTNEDFGDTANNTSLGEQGGRALRGAGSGGQHDGSQHAAANSTTDGDDDVTTESRLARRSTNHRQHSKGDLIVTSTTPIARTSSSPPQMPNSAGDDDHHRGTTLQMLKKKFLTYFYFVGPGFMISVAYIDPGNYSTDITAGASYRFRLLFVVLLSNFIAIFLQSLAIKVGTVSGLNLAQLCRAHLPRWLNYFLYVFAEAAIIATDIAEVIGFAIALNLLIPQVPLVAGCAISIIDVMVILLFYNPDKSMRGIRYFEGFVACLVIAVVVCFCIQMSLIRNATVGEVFQGYLPSKYLVEQQAIFQACGILGATVMPHSLYLGSGIVQPRLRDYDERSGLMPRELASTRSSVDDDEEVTKGYYYVPSMRAIKHSLNASIVELALSLFTFALFVNSAILIVAGAALYQNEEALSADIFGIHDLLARTISRGAGTLFALALLFSGVSAGIICTIAGQMVSEGAIDWKLKPWVRRLVTRSISITPSIIIAGAVGRPGLNAALNGSQVALSIILPFVTAPLIYFSARDKFMTVFPGNARLLARDSRRNLNQDGDNQDDQISLATQEPIKMANSWFTTGIAILVWLFIAIMNVANLVFLGKGED